MDFNDQYKVFLEDIQKNITNEVDKAYIEKRFSDFVNTVIVKLKENKENSETKMKEYEKTQNALIQKVNELENAIGRIEDDLYEYDEYDLEIKCPYCSATFTTDVEEVNKELECPSCENIIEIDWTEAQEKNYTFEEDEDM